MVLYIYIYTYILGGGCPNKHHLFSPPLDLDRLLDNLIMSKSVFESLGTTSDRKIIRTLK